MSFVLWLVSVAVAAVPQGAVAVVQGSSATVRAQPEGAALARLRIGSDVEVVGERAGWSQVRLLGRPEAHAVAGWVRSDLLRDTPVTLDEAIGRSRHADDAHEARTWAERAFALAPHHPDAMALRHAVAVEEADEATRLRLEDRSSEPVYLGICEGGRARVVVRLDGDEITSLSGLSSDELAPLTRHLGGWAWYRQGAVTPMGGTPFPTPFLAPTDNEEGGSAYEAGEDLMSGNGHSMFVALGPCEGGGLLATHPLPIPLDEAVASPRDRVATAWAAADQPVVGGRARRPVAGLPIDEVQLTVWHEPSTCGGPVGYHVRATAYALVGPAMGEPVLRLADEQPLGWVRIGDRFLGAYASHDLSFAALQLHLVAGDEVRHAGVHLGYWGC